MFLLLLACDPTPTEPAPTVAEAPEVVPVAKRVHVDRAARTLTVFEGDLPTHSESIGIGRGGLGSKTGMSDFITPTGTFTVDLVLHDEGTHNAVSDEALSRFASEPEYLALLQDPAALFANMNRLDFDGDGRADRAYGDAYVGLHGEQTGPKMRRHSTSDIAYWYSIALHDTPAPENLGAANSGGCVHVSSSLLGELITDGVLALGVEVTIADGPTLPE